jgi:hypothetical protein
MDERMWETEPLLKKNVAFDDIKIQKSSAVLEV